MIYTVTFNPAIDYVVRLDAPLEVGEVNRAKGEDCVLGGKGINVSGVLAQLGCESVALGFVAGETGAWLERGLAAQVALHDVVVVDALTQLCFFLFGEVFYTGVGIYTGHCQYFVCAGSADTVDISESYLNSLVLGQVNAGYTCHIDRSFLSIIIPHFCGSAWLIPAGGSLAVHAGSYFCRTS